MTVRASVNTRDTRVPIVLRKGVMDARDAAICRAVWRVWAESGSVSIREVLQIVGLSSTSILSFRMHGIDGNGAKHRRGGLLQRGWLSKDGSHNASSLRRTLRPGPRFAGLDNGWPLELIRSQL